jgi:RNA polymerase sigma factor (sigma-70 family)
MITGPMLKPLPTPTKPAPLRHEDLFVQRYGLLMNWSRKLTRHNEQMAEDLLHDVFVQFTLARPNLEAIDNLDGYLYSMLRNRHLSSMRRAARVPMDQLSTEEYDSAEARLRSTDPRQRIKVLDELRTICRYACARKRTSRAGSILILRFFLGYYPTEIVQVSKSSRPAVDSWLKIARTEARSYLDDPGRLAFLGAAGQAAIGHCDGSHSDFLLELRSSIFSASDTECPSSPGLQEIYTAPAGICSEDLAHVVSCAACLDTANSLLGLPPLRDRYPADTVGRDNGPRSGGTGISTSTGGRLARCRRKAKEVFEHSASKLSVSVNGFRVGTQTICSEISEVTLNLNVDERIGFVEVHSEQDVLLLAMDVEPPPEGPAQQSSCIELSDDRSIDLAISFVSAWPELKLRYRDPALTAAVVSPADASDQAGDHRVVKALSIADEPPPAAGKPVQGSANCQVASLPIPTGEGRGGARNWVLRMLDLIPDGFWLRPATITAALTIILIAALLLVRLPVPAVSAAVLLDKASESEKLMLARPDSLIHRILTMEARDLNRNLLISHRKIETWGSSRPVSGHSAARRVYDEHGRLLALEFVDEHGSSQIYRSSGPGVEFGGQADDALLSGKEIWRTDMSAARFASLVAGLQNAAVTEDSRAYHIRYDNNRGFAPEWLVMAALVLAKPGLHVIEETIDVRRNGALVEYKFVEDVFEHVKPTALPAGAFKVDATLTPPEGVLPPPGSGSAASPTASPHPADSVTATADLEVEVEYLLDRVKANQGEQVAVSRTPDDKLLVKGIVDTASRKSRILEGLASVAHNPAVRIDISTVDEIARRGKQVSGSVTVQKLEIVAATRIPVFAELRRHFLEIGISEAQLDEQVSRFSARVLQESGEALRNAWALRRLADQMSRNAGQALTTQARSKQLVMISEHASSCISSYERLQRDLEPIFPGVGLRGSPDAVKITDETDLARMLRLLVAQAAAADAAVRSAFTISSGKSELGQDWRSRLREPLRNAEELASSIARFARDSGKAPVTEPGE